MTPSVERRSLTNAPQCSYKADFHYPPDGAYFDCAAGSLLPLSAVAAAQNSLNHRSEPWCPSPAMQAAEAVRRTFASLINAQASDIAITPSTTYTIALAARILPLRPGRRVVMLDNEHPCQILAWRAKCEAVGALAVLVRRHSEGDWTEALLAQIDEQTGIVCVPACHWLDGAPIDLVKIGCRVRAVGAALVIDGTQSIGAMPFDIQTIQPDVVAVSGFKWLFGPVGYAYAYIHPRHTDKTPLEDGWLNRGYTDGLGFDPSGQLIYRSHWAEGARRFDAAEVANSAASVPALAGLTWILDHGSLAIQQVLAGRNAALINDLPNCRFRRNSAGATHILALDVDDPVAARSHLRNWGIYASVHGRILRLSGHLWNDQADIERARQMLDDLSP